ncbi:hypothetical protein DMX03_25475, partial [Pseudomonas koreensis]
LSPKGARGKGSRLIVPTLRVVTPPWTLCVHCDAGRHGLHSHAERGNDQCGDQPSTAGICPNIS